ncbi:MAG TPA: Hsp20/alpha crystallin family protein [Bryobacteraceae bacterium]|jgi:HSP20 family protein|nr:Hsp20/alpha crystallin family protein [Bryobacteraceae bacterium]
MTTTALEPFRSDNALVTLEREMERVMDGFFGRRFPRFRFAEPAVSGPGIEMYDHKDEIVVKAEVPGLDRSDVHVTIDGDVLTVKGERKREKETKDEDYYVCESSYGVFSRNVRLPVAVKTDKITATLNNGILQVHLPKAEEARKDRVPIEVK